MTPPLAGIRVLDLTRFVSGAYCTMVLSALGADVIKVEGLPGGDPYRAQGAVKVGTLSGLFASLNAGKRSLAVDLRADDGRRLIRTLAAASDVFVQNARPGSLDRAGLARTSCTRSTRGWCTRPSPGSASTARTPRAAAST